MSNNKLNGLRKDGLSKPQTQTRKQQGNPDGTFKNNASTNELTQEKVISERDSDRSRSIPNGKVKKKVTAVKEDMTNVKKSTSDAREKSQSRSNGDKFSEKKTGQGLSPMSKKSTSRSISDSKILCQPESKVKKRNSSEASSSTHKMINKRLVSKHSNTSSQTTTKPKSTDASKNEESSPSFISRITFYLNGDKLFAGKQVLVDSRQTRTLEQLLDLLVVELEPRFGPILRLFDASTYQEISSLAQVQKSSHIIAGGRGNVKKIDYLKIPNLQQKTSSSISLDTLQRPIRKHDNVESRVLKEKPPKQILVLVNGDEDGVPTRVVLRPRAQEDWSLALQNITERISDRLLYGSVQRLFTLEGLEVNEPSNLVSDGVYVAVDKLPLKIPPFELVNGRLQRKPAKKLKLPPVKVEAPQRKEVLVAAFGRTGLGFLHNAEQVSSYSSYKDPTTNSFGEKPPPIYVHHISNDDDIGLSVDLLIHGIQTSRRFRQDKDRIDAALCGLIRRARERLFEHRQTAPSITTAFDSRIEEVIQFMLNSDVRADFSGVEDITKRFEVMVQAGISGRLAHWESTPSSFVALVILLDQFPRAIYRGTSEMFVGDIMARAVILRALFHSSIMQELHPVYRLFPCIALSHQEDIEMQRLCLSEWEETMGLLDEDDPIRGYQTKFEHNLAVIEQFGRFPDRNDILHRKTTSSEKNFLGMNGKVPRRSSSNSAVQNTYGRVRLFEENVTAVQ